jgi:hypothetical protein
VAVSLSVLKAGRALPLRKIPGIHFCWSASKSERHSAAAGIMKIEKITITSSGLEPVTCSIAISANYGTAFLFHIVHTSVYIL